MSGRRPPRADRATTPKALVRRFYETVWNDGDKDAIPELLHEDLRFRGSLGVEKRGHAGFAEYLDLVRGALGEYRCDIEELVAEGDRVCAWMSFQGIHRGDLLGYAATRRKVGWQGCALFRISGSRIADIRVLGDLKGLEEQLRGKRR